MIRNIVFDMGMVLMHYDPLLPCRRHAASEDEALIVRDALFGAPEWGARMDAGTIDEADFLTLVQSRLQTPRLRELAAKVLDDWLLDGLYPITGMDAVAEALHARGFKLYVLSNMCLRFREIEYKIPNYKLFEGALVSAEEKLLKPDPSIFKRLCDKFSLKPEECLFIDDLQRNVDGARSVGMSGYCFENCDVAALRGFLDEI